MSSSSSSDPKTCQATILRLRRRVDTAHEKLAQTRAENEEMRKVIAQQNGDITRSVQENQRLQARNHELHARNHELRREGVNLHISIQRLQYRLETCTDILRKLQGRNDPWNGDEQQQQQRQPVQRPETPTLDASSASFTQALDTLALR